MAAALVPGLLIADASSAQASSNSAASGTIEGRVVDGQGQAVPGIEVRLVAADRSPADTDTDVDTDADTNIKTTADNADDGRTTITDERGLFRFADVEAPGRHHLTCLVNGQPQGRARTIVVRAGVVARTELTLALGFLDEVTVTDFREERLKRETAASVATVDRETIAAINPTHPGQLLSRLPGVWVNTTGGEGHMTAIRQPLTTNPVYLFLEDGVPTRSTGFFNHNALYEVNVPAAERIEVTKGPGSALYGSDAIGGVINVISRSSLGRRGAELNAEGGAYGWRRLIAGGSVAGATQGLRADVNLTHTDGWRDATGYDRRAATLRYDRAGSGAGGGAGVGAGGSGRAGDAWFLKVLASYSTIDQQTAGSSVLQVTDYEQRPRLNLTPISFRNVEAFRLSADYQRTSGALLWNVIPYFRANSMGLLANWSLTYDPTVYDTRNTSYGVLAKVRRDLRPWRTQLLAGVDVDVSPGDRFEQAIRPQTTPGPQGQTIFSAYTVGDTIYDYDVRFVAASPYVNVELSPLANVRASAGLRYDRMSYRYDDTLDTPPTPRYLRPADATRTYDRVSPKLGITWQIAEPLNAFASYRQAFRAPSEGQLFRQGSTRNTIDLEPVRASNVEVGLRAAPMRGLSLEGSIYRLDKRDDILSFRDPVDGATDVLNAGHTRHRGVELGAEVTPRTWLWLHASYSRARHTYEAWVVDPARGLDYSGKDIETAPRDLGDASITVTPRGWLMASAEVSRVGRYWMDAANTHRYAGHTLLNLRTEVRLREGVRLFARLLNAADARYAESSSFTLQRGEEFAPGLPRTAYVGARIEWRP